MDLWGDVVELAEKYDVAIIGAGVIGLFTAYLLLEKRLSVVVVEKNSRPGQEASTRNANVIHVVQTPFNSLKSRLCIEGNILHKRYSEIIGYRLEPLDTLLVTRGMKGAVIGRIAYWLLKRYRNWGFKVEKLSRQKIREVEPLISRDVDYAVLVGGYGIVDSRELVDKLEKTARSLGASFMYNNEVDRVEVDRSSRIRLGTKQGGEILAKYVVNSAGLYADRVAGLFGDKYSIKPVKGVMALYRDIRVENIIASAIVAGRKKTKGGGIIPQLDGRVLLGPTYEEASSRSDYYYTRESLRALEEKFRPLLRDDMGEPVEVVVGLRATTSWRDYIIEYSRAVGPRVVRLVGIESPGLTAAPAIAEKVVYMLLGDT